MRIIHLSDLHIGKRVNEYPMLEEQEYILLKILNIIDEEKPDAVIIAGDVYDKTLPSAEAVLLLDKFLTALSSRGLKVFIISGNHDSAERLSFGSGIMQRGGIYLSPVYSGEVEPITLSDEFGTLNFYLLPFIKPVHVRSRFPDETIESYSDAVKIAIANMNINAAERNILITHQFVTGASRSESEEISVGGSDNVDTSLFDAFDYVALGHIHGPQSVGRETVRYCGTPLKYSFSEKSHKKSLTVIDMGEKGDIDLHTIPLIPKHDWRELKGSYDELTLKANYEGTATDDFIRIVLTDEDDVPDALSRLRLIYPNIMQLVYDNKRTRSRAVIDNIENPEQKSESEIFAEFYTDQNGKEMSEEQMSFVCDLFEKLKEEKA
ncbi:MAG: exonuclease SbcCD subunit D [Firmicutes bacterium]|nr:exonuclease SbcCD subunit D [Bacillota bacterium]